MLTLDSAIFPACQEPLMDKGKIVDLIKKETQTNQAICSTRFKASNGFR